MLVKVQAFVSELEEKVAAGFLNIEERLDVIGAYQLIRTMW